MHKRTSGTVFSLFSLPLTALFLLPLVSVVAFSLTSDADDDVWQHLQTTVLPEYIWNSWWLAVGTALGSMLLGVSAALLLALYTFPGKRLWQIALILPLGLPTYLVTYAYASGTTLLGEMPEPFYGLPGAIALFSLTLYPYVLLATTSALNHVEQNTVHAARNLGATPWQLVTKIMLPACTPAIIAGVLAVIVESLIEFGTVDYLGLPVFATGIYRAWVGLDSLASAMRLSLGLLTIIGLLVWLGSRYKPRPNGQGKGIQSKPTPYGLLASAWCLAIVLLAIGFPLLSLARQALDNVDILPATLLQLRNSILLAILAAIVITAVGIIAVYQRLKTQLLGLLGLGHIMPGPTLAVALLASLAWLQTEWHLPIAGVGIAVLVYAYGLRFGAPAWRLLFKAKDQLPENRSAAAQTLGASGMRTALQVELPLLRPAIIGGGLLVFIEVLKELPATLLLRSAGMDTLAVSAYQLASDEQLSAAAVPGVLLGTIGVIGALVYLKSKP